MNPKKSLENFIAKKLHQYSGYTIKINLFLFFVRLIFIVPLILLISLFTKFSELLEDFGSFIEALIPNYYTYIKDEEK